MKTQSKKGKEKVVFFRRLSRSGQAKILIITVPRAVQGLLEFGKTYKVSIEETEISI